MLGDIFDATPPGEPPVVARPRWKAQGPFGMPQFRCSFTDDQGRRQVTIVEACSPAAAQSRARRDGMTQGLVIGNYLGAPEPRPAKRKPHG